MEKRKYFLTIIIPMLMVMWLISPVCATDAPGGTGTITVHKFHDINRNGIQDEGESDIEGWLIRIYNKNEAGAWIVVADGLTGPDGIVSFLLEGNTYGVWNNQIMADRVRQAVGKNIAWSGHDNLHYTLDIDCNRSLPQTR